MIILAEEFDGFDGVSLLLLIAAIAASAAWLVVFAWRWFATRPKLPETGLEARDAGDEAPALVNLLVNRWHLTKASIQATMMDLASRKHIGIDMYGDDQFVVRVRNDASPGDKLTPYESQLLALVKERAHGGSIPAEALTLGHEKEAENWWERFRKSVEKDARDLGLARRRWAQSDWTILGATLAAALGLVALTLGAAHVGDGDGDNALKLDDWLIFAAVAWGAIMVLLGTIRNIRDTPLGREVCARWLGVRKYLQEINAFDDVPVAAVIIWERYLAYGAALGVAKDATRQLPLAPDDPETAWSRQTGHWREVRVEYPKSFGYGGWPLGVFAGGLVRVVFFGAIVFVFLPIVAQASWDVVKDGLEMSEDTTVDTDTFALQAGFVAAFVVVGFYPFTQLVNGLIRMFQGGSDLLSKPQLIEGTVVKLHAGRFAIDDGKSDELDAWLPSTKAPTPPSLGAHVRATVSPRLDHVFAIETLTPPPSS